MAVIKYDVKHTSLRDRSCKSTIMIISHTDADGVVSAFVNRLFSRIYTDELSPNVVTLGMTSPSPSSTMSAFKYGLSVCMNEFGKSFSADEFIIVVSDRDFFSVQDYNYIRETYGKYTKKLRFICMDHHATNILINGEYDEILKKNNDIEMNIRTESDFAGCNLSLSFWEQFAVVNNVAESRMSDANIKFDDIRDVVTNTRNWDTFIWREMGAEDQEHALQMNAMNSALGPKLMFTKLMELTYHMFCERVGIKNSSGDDNPIPDLFTELKSLRELCKSISDQKIESSLDNHLWQMRTEVANIGTDVVKFGILFGVEVEVQSMFAQKVFEMDKYYDLDVIAFINYYGTVSVRIRDGRESIINGSELGKYAGKLFGTNGGGHANACGFTIDYNIERKIELGQKTLDALYGILDVPAPEFKLETK